MKKPTVTASEKEKGILDILFDFFRSLKLTIFVLILISILSIIGTLIKQNAPSMEYIERYGVKLYNVLDFFNLFDMYRSWWFSAILMLLVVNLIACSIHRFPGIWNQISRGSGPRGLEDSMLRTLPYVERIHLSNPKGGKEDEIRSHLKRWFKNPQRIEGESSTTFYLEKGRFSRLGVYITHLSILVILIGGLAGSLYGFRGFVNILEGETVDQIYLRIKDEEVAKPIGFSIRCDDFRVTFYDLQRPEKLVKEYSSDLAILENGKEILKKTIEVNHPLHYKGLAFYQSSYGTIHDVTLGVQWKNKKEKTMLKAHEGETIAIPQSQAALRILRYATQVHNFGEGVQVALLRPNQPPQPLWLLKGFPKFDQQRNDDFILSLEGVASKEYTGLQVTKDPGVWIVWTGCSLMIIGLIVSFFFSHQRVWVRIPRATGGEIVLAGSTNKNKVGFEKTFNQLAEEVRSKSSEFRVRSSE
ncbi:MAG: cytochrome c biogenesis protein ResB [Thermodesulfobacteriota bacterium]|nr:cytochrome c biogenesis protein ResB [Thermodesulfobacteriota bacterium]